MSAYDEIEKALYLAFERAIKMIHDSTKVDEIIESLVAGDVEGAIDAIRFEIGTAELDRTIPQALRASFETAGLEQRGALQRQLGADVIVGFDVINPEAVEWLRTEAAALIKNFGTSSMAAIRKLIDDSFAAGLTPRDLARMIYESGIGLDDRRLNALERFRQALAKDPNVSAAKVEKLTKEYGERLARERARIIAGHETRTAKGAGNRELWRQAKERGLLDDRAEERWDTTGQENVCPECDDLDGETIPVGGTFSNGSVGTPAHVACQCNVSLWPFGAP